MILRKAVVEYHERLTLKPALLCILIYTGAFLFFTGISTTDNFGSGWMSGLEPIFGIFFLIVCMSTFSEDTHFFLQHGVSRKAIFAGFAVYMLIASAIAALAMLLMDGFFRWVTSFEAVGLQTESLIFGLFAPWLGTMGTVTGLLVIFLWSWAMLLLAGVLGYFIASLFYRLNKLGKVLVPVGAGVVFVFLPLIIGLSRNEMLSQIMRWFWETIRGRGDMASPMNSMGIFFLLAALLLFVCWLLLRRFQVRK